MYLFIANLPATKSVPLAAPNVDMATHKGTTHFRYFAPSQSPITRDANVYIIFYTCIDNLHMKLSAKIIPQLRQVSE